MNIAVAEHEPQPKPRKIRVGPKAELIEGRCEYL